MVIFCKINCRNQVQNLKNIYLISEAYMHFIINQKGKIIPTLDRIDIWVENIKILILTFQLCANFIEIVLDEIIKNI